jgi:cysteinyl-tRNA synthetase
VPEVPDLKLYDTLSRTVAPVVPREPGRIGVYICGPTVYSYIHVGNGRPFWLGQMLKRFGEGRLDLTVTVVGNITDINDKIYAAARAEGRASDELARDYTQAYIDDTSRLGLGRPDAEPRATEWVPEMVAFIADLIDRELAYESGGDVYFRVAAFPSYGQLSGQRPDELIEGARVELGENKEAPADFALWKGRKLDEDTWWPSPWGEGRPGWHIECSVMSEQLLGPGFEIHGGGLDLVFPHHENERAQSEGAGRVPFTRGWVHNGILRIDAEKMSKSDGNIERLRDALDRVGPLTLCAFFASAVYRSPQDYDDEGLARAAASNDRFREALRSARRYAAAGGRGTDDAVRAAGEEAGRRFDVAMADDLDTPAALAALHGLARELNAAVAGGVASPAAVEQAADELVACLDVLGLGGLDAQGDGAVPVAARRLMHEREAARAARDFARADRLREELAHLGYAVRDTPQGAEIVPVEP